MDKQAPGAAGDVEHITGTAIERRADWSASAISDPAYKAEQQARNRALGALLEAVSAAEIRAAVLEGAAKACEAQRVEETGTDGDIGYNQATVHCARAVRSLATTSTEPAAATDSSDAASDVMPSTRGTDSLVLADDAALRDAVWKGLKGLYYCGRVWDAWQVGTMSQDDFTPAEDLDECIDGVVDEIRAAASASPVPRAQGGNTCNEIGGSSPADAGGLTPKQMTDLFHVIATKHGITDLSANGGKADGLIPLVLAELFDAIGKSIGASPAPSAKQEPSEVEARIAQAKADLMPRREAFIKFLKARSLDEDEKVSAWGEREFKHSHIESMWFGWYNALDSAAPASASASPAAPGFVLVPVKPTPAMLEAAAKADDEGFEAGRSHGASGREIYDAMLAASPAAAVAAPDADKLAIARKALERIARWTGEFPDTGRTWDDGSPMSYGAQFGSNGERDYMRQLASDAHTATAGYAVAAPAPANEQAQAVEAVAAFDAWVKPRHPSLDTQHNRNIFYAGRESAVPVAGSQHVPTQRQVLDGVKALLQCCESELGDYSPKLMDGYEADVRRVYAAFADFAAAAPAVPVPAEQAWISVKDQLPLAGEVVLVYSPPTQYDHPGEVNIRFDCIDPNDDDHTSWLNHNEHYEHFCCVAKPEGSVGPSAEAPYTYWAPIPAAPSLQQPKEGAA